MAVRRLAAILAVLAFLPGGPGTAQEPSGTVTVTGSRSTPVERRARAGAYVRGTGVAIGERPVARWIDPFCPKVVGLKPEDRHAVGERVRAIARTAGVRVADDGCTPNAIVAFVSDGKATMRTIAAKRSRTLKDVSLPDRRTLLGGERPIRWWYAIRPLGADGDPPSSQPPPAVLVEGGGSLPANDDTAFQTVRGSGFIRTEAIRTIYAAYAVIDAPRVGGIGLAAASDFAALVLLAEVRATDTPPPGSILGLLTAGAPPATLTAWDRRFLRELYRLPLDRPARRQRQLLARALAAPGEPRDSPTLDERR